MELLGEHYMERTTNSIGLFSGAGLIFVTVTYDRRAVAKHAQRVEAAYKWALKNAHLPEPLKQPAERLCLAILRDEGAFQNRRLPPVYIEVVLRDWLFNLLHSKDKQLQLSTLLTNAKGGEATFSVPLYTLHANVAGAIGGLYDTINQDLSWAGGHPAEGTPFRRLVRILYRHWARVNRFDPDLGEQPPQKNRRSG
jgi:hypothetical protein